VIKISKKKATKKWHRVNFFMKEKKSNPEMKKLEEHPALIFEQSRTHYKGIHFISHSTTKGEKNVPLLHNVDPDEKNRRSYAVPYKEPRPKKEYQIPDKNYRIHKDDKATINSLKRRK
jgi:hypothetical protein